MLRRSHWRQHGAVLSRGIVLVNNPRVTGCAGEMRNPARKVYSRFRFMHPLDEEDDVKKDDGIYFDPEGVKVRPRRARRARPVQFSLWTLLIVVTVICLIGAAIRGGLEIVLLGLCATTFVCGFLFFGVLIYRLCEAVLLKSAEKSKSLVRMVLDGLLGAGLVFSLLVLGAWIYAEATYSTRSRIDDRYIKLREAMMQEDFATGYAMMTPQWRKRHTLAQFKNEPIPPALEPSRSLVVFGDSAWLDPRSHRLLELWSFSEFRWRRIDGEWCYTGEGDPFVE
jgi:hypothetical protein